MSSTKERELKERKAASQRRYYQRNKTREQAKARIRANNKRSQTKLLAGRLEGIQSTSPSSPLCLASEALEHSPPNLLTLSPHPADGSPSPSCFPDAPSSPSILDSPRQSTRGVSPSSTETSNISLVLPATRSISSTSRSVSPSSTQTFSRPSSSEAVEASILGVPDEILIWWPTWSARRRLSSLRRWILDVEWKEGAFDTWNTRLMSEWAGHRYKSPRDVKEWSDGYTQKVGIGRLILQYLGRVMDGQLQGGSGTCELTLQEECRDLSLQIHQLSTPVSSAVAGLEVGLKWMQL
ncbi:hypothetical protein HWV62_10675 [Athelia sp. TMB]|nr:hypothetical protein HWV62_10675 [Athelia sp. TMB]